MNALKLIAQEAKPVINKSSKLKKKSKVAMKKNKSQIKQRMLYYLSVMNITPYASAKETGMSRGILSQNNGISEDSLMKFLTTYSDINTEWLIWGKGEMLIKSSPIKEYTTHFPDSLNTLAEDKEAYGTRQCVYYQVCKNVEELSEKINIMEEDIKQLKDESKNKITH